MARGEEQNPRVVGHRSQEGRVSGRGWSIVSKVADRWREKSGWHRLHKNNIPTPPCVNIHVSKYLHERAGRLVKSQGPKPDHLGVNAESIMYQWCGLSEVTPNLYASVSSFVKQDNNSSYLYVIVVRIK